MTVDKTEFDRSLRRARRFYREHEQGELSASSFITKARIELNKLYWRHTTRLVETTANATIAELQSLQRQFALNLNCSLSWNQVTRGYRGIRASLYVRNEGTYFGRAEIHIGPFDEWDRIAVHTAEELDSSYKPPSLYTKRNKDRWQAVSDFNFPELLQRIKEEAERPEPEEEDEIPF